MKNKTLTILGITFSLFSSTSIFGQSPSKKTPNVILIMSDDQGYGDLGCHGNDVIQTPNLDILHDESIRFTNFHVNPTSSPTRAALLTGRYSRRTGVWHTVMGREYLRTDEETIADVFSSNGYKTAMFGKWHLGLNYPFRPIDRGFQESVYAGGGSVSQMDDFWDNDRMNDSYYHNNKIKSYQGFCTDVFFDETFRFIEENRDNPFFVYLPINAPHGPNNTLDEWDKPYFEAGLDTTLTQFFASITRVDHNIGRLREFLDKQKLTDNTIILFLTDNGSAEGARYYNAGMKGSKGSLYEGGHRVPLFMKLPPKIKGMIPRDIQELTAHIDLLPTLMELCNLKQDRKNKLDGKSLLPLLSEKGKWDDRILFIDQQRIQYPMKWKPYVMMTKKWRMLNGKKLYDIDNDPFQKNNLAALHLDVVDRLKFAYEALWDEFADRDNSSGFARPIIGSSIQKTTKLCAIDLLLEHSSQLIVGQTSVREGRKTSGCWNIEVAKDGVYQFELRRWPREADTEITKGLPAIRSSENDINLNKWGTKPIGKALDIVQARLSVNEHDLSTMVKATDKAIYFDLHLRAGNASVRSWFYDKNSKDMCVYYVYITRK